MRREPPVRFREGLGVKFPRATRLVIGTVRYDDARRIMDVLPKRMSKHGLTVHPEKTRLVRFEPDDPNDSEKPDGEEHPPATFDFLGFTHYWGRSQKGKWVIKRQTSRSRLKRAPQACRHGVELIDTSRFKSNTRR